MTLNDMISNIDRLRLTETLFYLSRYNYFICSD